jgi:hypothetical protein
MRDRTRLSELITMLFRRTPHDWRIIHDHESALAASAAKTATQAN